MEKNILELEDYCYCPEYWNRKRESRNENFNSTDIINRYRKNLKKKSLLDQLEQEYSQKNKPPKKSKKKNNLVPMKLLFISIIILLVSLYVGGFVFWLSCSLLLLWLGIKNWKYFYIRILRKQTHPYNLFLKEKKINPQLILTLPITDKFNYYGRFSSLHWSNDQFVYTLDRSNIPLPSHSPVFRNKDSIVLSTYMHLIHHYFLGAKVKGVIQYSNYKKKLQWGTDTEKSLGEAKSESSKMKLPIPKYLSTEPAKCVVCEFKKLGCKKVKVTIPKKTEREENAEETYSSFFRAVQNLRNTTWTHWEQAVKELMKVIETSSIIQNAIKKHVQSEYSFDMKEEIKTAVLHQKGLFNRNITNNKSKEITFAYQLLHYLSKNRTVQLMKKLIGSYGKTEQYDDKTHPDEKIRNFFNNGAITNFIKMIDVHFETLIPKERREKILYNITNFNINGNNYGDIYQADNMFIDRDKEDDEAKTEKEKDKDDETDFLN